jgi:hypothetical protein
MNGAKYWILKPLAFDEYCRFPRFIPLAQAEVSKRQYSSKAKGSNVREGG